jgi:hypothetical protein
MGTRHLYWILTVPSFAVQQQAKPIHYSVLWLETLSFCLYNPMLSIGPNPATIQQLFK